MNLDLSTSGALLPIVIAVGLGVFVWWFRKQGAPPSAVDPFDQLASSMLDLAKRRLDQAQKDQYKAAAVEAIEKVMPADPAAPKK
jgi:hypothetical protein